MLPHLLQSMVCLIVLGPTSHDRTRGCRISSAWIDRGGPHPCHRFGDALRRPARPDRRRLDHGHPIPAIPYGATKRPRLVWLLAGRPLMARVASPPVAGVRRPACRPALASADEDPVDWPRRLAPHSRVVGCVRRCRNLVSIPGRSAASAVQPDVGHHHRRARPVPATGAPRGGVGGFVRRCGGCVAAAAGSRAVGRLWAWR